MIDAGTPLGPPLFVGIDLGWTTGGTGLAVVDEAGALIASGRVQTDDEIVEWVTSQPGVAVVAAVDAPLIVPNESGQRVPEQLIGKAFGAFGASAHVTNQVKFGGATPRAQVIADRLKWTTDPNGVASVAAPLCLEVYPHPALVGLFELPYRLDYKKGDQARRAAGMRTLLGHLESVAELRLTENARWREIVAAVAAPAPGQLARIEDEVDAVVCAHLAWLWYHRREALHVYGSFNDGYIVAPPAPTHRAVPPAVRKPAAAGLAVSRWVPGRPTGYGGRQREEEWKSSVRSAFAGAAPFVESRVAVELDFVLSSDQVGRNEPDLDNLIKSTIDALEGVLGKRSGTGARLEADDVRVDRIVATKRAGEREAHGATVTVREVGTARRRSLPVRAVIA